MSSEVIYCKTESIFVFFRCHNHRDNKSVKNYLEFDCLISNYNDAQHLSWSCVHLNIYQQ